MISTQTTIFAYQPRKSRKKLLPKTAGKAALCPSNQILEQIFLQVKRKKLSAGSVSPIKKQLP